MDQEIQNINTTTLAYMGDAVYEVRVREMLIEHDPHDVGKLHKMAVRYVSAEGQAKAMRKLVNGFLTEDEIRLYKRARNHRTLSRSTGFEALIGYLFLAEESDRLDEVIEEAIRIIEEE